MTDPDPTPEPAGATRFDRDTAVSHLGDGRYEARLDRGWWIIRGPNGGYLAAILTRAMQARVGDPSRHARSLTVHYLRPPAEGPVTIETEILREGRTLTSIAAHLFQDGKLQATAVAAFAQSREAPTLEHAAMPEVLPPEAIPADLSPAPIPMRERFEERWAIGERSEAGGKEALSGGWIRLAEPRPTDAALMALLADAWSPAVFCHFGRGTLTAGVPTVDLTVHFREPLPAADVAPGDWLLAVFRTRVARDGFMEEDGEIFTRDGRLLAQARQLAVVL